jgi:hypothetical protein
VDKESPEGVKSTSVRPNPNIVPTEVKFEISADDSRWYVKIKKENKEEENTWEFIKRRIERGSGGFSQEYITFETVDQAQEWCEKIGLL